MTKHDPLAFRSPSIFPEHPSSFPEIILVVSLDNNRLPTFLFGDRENPMVPVLHR